MNIKFGILELRDLTKYYGSSPGIMNVNLQIQAGEIFGFLGPNGAGKTTTMRLILGLIKPTKGEIIIFGKNKQANHRSILKQIGYLPGDLGLYKDLTGNELLNHLLRLRTGRNFDQDQEKLSILKKRFSIQFDKKIETYSKGMRQIIGLIQAFMHNPSLLILDEPTSGLDPFMQEAFFNLVLEERKNGKTIFLSSHILSEVEKICDRVGIIRDGRLIHIETMDAANMLFGKNVRIKTTEADQKIMEDLLNIGGVQNLSSQNGRIEFFFNGEFHNLMTRMANYKISDFTCETPRIEDLFFKFYED